MSEMSEDEARGTEGSNLSSGEMVWAIRSTPSGTSASAALFRRLGLPAAGAWFTSMRSRGGASLPRKVNKSLASNEDWKAWGELDPLNGVAIIRERAKHGANPWTDESFYEVGAIDWRRGGLF
jgi:hypothetical protein